jgi:hypothetical protein
MPKLRVHGFSISVDGYGAGPDQNLDNPLGLGGLALHEWAFATRTFDHHGESGHPVGSLCQFDPKTKDTSVLRKEHMRVLSLKVIGRIPI